MHILDLPVEVFVLVFKFLASRDLLRCAIVCSQWRDLALDVKWKEHVVSWENLLPLLGPVRECDWDENYCWVTKHSSIEDLVASAGWRRLNELRKKITRLRIETHLILEDINYLRSMHNAVECPDQAFCPKLRELEVRFADLQPYEYDFLAGGSLRKFKLTWTSPNRNGLVEVFLGAIRSLTFRSPMIEHITVFRSDSAFTNYGEFHKLRTLDHGGDFSVGSWIQLCEGCPLLEEVHIWWIQEDSELPDKSLIASAPDMQELPALRVLSLATIANGMFTSYILRTTNMPQLTGLEVNLEPLTSAEGDALLSLVRRRSPLLTSLKVHAHTLDWVSFALFGNLHDLEIYGTLGSWTTEHLERIFGNLPNLTRLVIAAPTEDGVDRTKPAFTPAILEMIATRCRLDQLEIPLNALGVPWMSEPQTPSAKFDGLTALALDPLHIDPNAKEHFAKYLAQLCPTVESFETMPLHPREIWSEAEPPWEITEEERKNMRVMENLFFDAQEEHVRSLG